MSRVPTTYNFGSDQDNENRDLVRQLSRMYSTLALEINYRVSKRVVSGDSPPASSDINKNFEIGDMWVRTDTNGVWIMTSRTTDIAVTWTAV